MTRSTRTLCAVMLLLGGATVRCASHPAPQRSVAMRAHLVADAESPTTAPVTTAWVGDATSVMVELTITAGDGSVLAAPRICTRIGQSASISIGEEREGSFSGLKVEVLAHRQGDEVLVDATMSEFTDGRRTTTATIGAVASAP